MKLFTLTVCLPLLLMAMTGFGQGAEKVLVKSFNLDGSQLVQLDIQGDVEVREWSNNYLRVQMTVQIENGTEALLKSLVRAGRYNLYAQSTDGACRIGSPGLVKQVRIGEEALKEHLSYVVYSPANVEIEQSGNEAATSRAEMELLNL